MIKTQKHTKNFKTQWYLRELELPKNWPGSKFFKTRKWLLLKPGPGPLTRTLKNLGLEKPEPWKTWTLQNLDPEKHGFCKTSNKYGIKKYFWLIGELCL